MIDSQQDLEKRLLAAAIFELRVLLSPYLAEEDSPAGSAARIAYALHNQALSILSGKPIDVQASLDSLDRLEPMLGAKYLEQSRRTVLGEQHPA